MDKYDNLWRHLRQDGRHTLTLTFDEIEEILGFQPRATLATYKKEAARHGYRLQKTSITRRYITFAKTDD